MKFGWPWGVSPTYSTGSKGPFPRISVVTPNYNGAKYIEATIRSVICQGYPNLQYIVVDGASTDESMDIINRYKDHISVIISEPDRGHSDALNKGFAKADGEILAFLNSDDMYLPWTFQTVAEAFAAFPQMRWIQGLPSVWDDHGRLWGSRDAHPINKYDFLIGRYEWIQQESTFWKKDLWDEAGGHMALDYKLMIDGELWSRFFLHARLYNVAYMLGGFRLHTTNRSHNKTLLKEEMARALEALRKSAAPEDVDLARRFTMLQRLLKPIPSGMFRLAIARWLTHSDFEKMGYDIVWQDMDGWHSVIKLFR